jgi:hypothetical protein
VTGKDSEIAIAAGNLDFFSAALNDEALRGDDFEFDGVCHGDVLSLHSRPNVRTRVECS